MKVCIYGAGATGGYMGLMLQEGGADVSLIARGGHLAAIKEKGRLMDVSHPNSDAVLGLVQQLGRVHGVYPTYPEADPADDPEEAAVD